MDISNIILISLDNLRYDCVGYQNDKHLLNKHNVLELLQTPTLDAIANESVCFSNCFSTNTYTPSAHVSMFTGLYPPRHGVRSFNYRLPGNITTITKILRENGFTTIFASDEIVPLLHTGLSKEFDYVFEKVDSTMLKVFYSHAIKKNKVFLFVHFFDIHSPFLYSYNEPYHGYNDDYFTLIDELKARVSSDQSSHFKVWQAYADSVNYDAKILFPLYVKGITKFDTGRFNYFIESIGPFINDNSVIAIVSDHGEGRSSLKDSAGFTHGGELFDDVLRIPLVLQYPGCRHHVDNRMASIVDVFPTILDVAGLGYGNMPIDGVSLLGNDSRESVYADVFSMSTDGDSQVFHDFVLQRSLRTETSKVVLCGKPEVFIEQEAFEGAPEDFIRRLFRSLMRRFEDPEGYNHYLNALTGSAMGLQGVMNEFLHSSEYDQMQPVAYCFDLDSDPDENTPINLIHRTDHIFEEIQTNSPLVQLMELEKHSVDDGYIFSSPAHRNNNYRARISKVFLTYEPSPLVTKSASKENASTGSSYYESMLSSDSRDFSSVNEIPNNGILVVAIRFVVHEHLEEPSIGFYLKDSFGCIPVGTNTYLEEIPLNLCLGKEYIAVFKYDLTLRGVPITPGHYSLTVNIHKRDSHLLACYHWLEDIVSTDIVQTTHNWDFYLVKYYQWLTNIAYATIQTANKDVSSGSALSGQRMPVKRVSFECVEVSSASSASGTPKRIECLQAPHIDAVSDSLPDLSGVQWMHLIKALILSLRLGLNPLPFRALIRRLKRRLIKHRNTLR